MQTLVTIQMNVNTIKKKLLAAPRRVKQSLAVLIDACFCLIASGVALGLRADQWALWDGGSAWMSTVGVLIALPLFTVFGLYRAIFRYAGLQMLYTLIKVLTIYVLIYLVVFNVISVDEINGSLLIIQSLVFSFEIIVSRLFVRSWLGGDGSKYNRLNIQRALIYGAGPAGRQLAASMQYASDVLILGFIEEDVQLHGRLLNGLLIFGPAQLNDVVTKYGITHVYLAMPESDGCKRNEIIKILISLRLHVLTLPNVTELATGKVIPSDLKEIDIEDLLGRPPVPPNTNLLKLKNAEKVVLVTGAGGSIGSELCRHILQTEPLKLLLVDISEYALYAIEQDLMKIISAKNWQGKVDVIPLLADVRNTDRMMEIIRTWKPQTVYHAAAYKHVPLVEHNPVEGISTNVFGTWNTAEQCMLHGVNDFVLISTDKAVRPTNVMGASKRLAEMVLQALAEKAGQQRLDIRLSMVRFGNVLGSSGSVVPLFRRQIQQGGPITLTDSKITRYFMTIPEAAQLVIQAGAMAEGGDVFVLDMGDSIKIIDLARKMIELSGLKVRDAAFPDGDIAIQEIGLRPGEKMYEELLIGANPIVTIHPRIMKAHEDFLPWNDLQNELTELKNAMAINNVLQIRRLLQKMVLGYQPDSNLADWVWLEQHKNEEY